MSDICTKNLPSKPFEKHLNELVSDVGLFTRCNTRQMGKTETWEDTYWAKKERLRRLAKPMGEIRKYHHYGFIITKWYLDYMRLRKKRIQRPLQRNYMRRKYDQTGSFIYAPERHVIKKYMNSQGEIVKIYDTDELCILDKVVNRNSDFGYLLTTSVKTLRGCKFTFTIKI